jgi:hypothetical protein
MNIQISSWRVGLLSMAALSLVACGGETAPAATDAAGAGDMAVAGQADGAMPSGVAPAASTDAASAGLLAMPPWMPADWDRNALPLQDFNLDAENLRIRRNHMILTAPLVVWAMAHDTTKDEKFQPVWVWLAALRSCERAIQLVDDLSGEFGDRARGAATLTAVRNELMAYAATQPPEITMQYATKLGQWNENTGNFPLQGLDRASNVDPVEAERVMGNNYIPGANVLYYADKDGQGFAGFDAGTDTIECMSADKQKIHKFWRESAYAVRFGDVERGMGGLPLYNSYVRLPDFGMSREQAAALVQRNPERKVLVSVTFGPEGTAFVEGIDHSAVRGKIKAITIKDAIDGSVLATKTY